MAAPCVAPPCPCGCCHPQVLFLSFPLTFPLPLVAAVITIFSSTTYINPFRYVTCCLSLLPPLIPLLSLPRFAPALHATLSPRCPLSHFPLQLIAASSLSSGVNIFRYPTRNLEMVCRLQEGAFVTAPSPGLTTSVRTQLSFLRTGYLRPSDSCSS